MFKHKTSARVQYGETDQMGYLYHGNYARYFELGRVEALRALGLTYQEMEKTYQVLMPVMSLNMRFVRPAYYDELLTIETVLRKLPDQFITFQTDIYNPQGKLVNGGSVKIGFLDAETRASITVPECLLSRLKPYF